jgi:hypothetical protein
MLKKIHTSGISLALTLALGISPVTAAPFNPDFFTFPSRSHSAIQEIYSTEAIPGSALFSSLRSLVTYEQTPVDPRAAVIADITEKNPVPAADVPSLSPNPIGRRGFIQLSSKAAVLAMLLPPPAIAKTVVEHLPAVSQSTQNMEFMGTLKTMADVVKTVTKRVKGKKLFDIYEIGDEAQPQQILFIHTANREVFLNLVGRATLLDNVHAHGDLAAILNDRQLTLEDDLVKDGRLDQKDFLKGIRYILSWDPDRNSIDHRRVSPDIENWTSFKATHMGLTALVRVYNTYQKARTLGLDVILTDAEKNLFTFLEDRGMIVPEGDANPDGSASQYKIAVLNRPVHIAVMPYRDMRNENENIDKLKDDIKHELIHLLTTREMLFDLHTFWMSLDPVVQETIRTGLGHHNVWENEEGISQEEGQRRHLILLRELLSHGYNASKNESFERLNPSDRDQIQSRIIEIIQTRRMLFLSSEVKEARKSMPSGTVSPAAEGAPQVQNPLAIIGVMMYGVGLIAPDAYAADLKLTAIGILGLSAMFAVGWWYRIFSLSALWENTLRKPFARGAGWIKERAFLRAV